RKLRSPRNLPWPEVVALSKSPEPIWKLTGTAKSCGPEGIRGRVGQPTSHQDRALMSWRTSSGPRYFPTAAEWDRLSARLRAGGWAAGNGGRGRRYHRKPSRCSSGAGNNG